MMALADVVLEKNANLLRQGTARRATDALAQVLGR